MSTAISIAGPSNQEAQSRRRSRVCSKAVITDSDKERESEEERPTKKKKRTVTGKTIKVDPPCERCARLGIYCFVTM